MTIILLEDDQSIAKSVIGTLHSRQLTCEHFSDGERFLHRALNGTYDLAIMDWQLPGRDGIEILRDLRARQTWRLPVIFLTQRDDEADIVTALDAGADDYIIKPLRSSELLARVAAVCRRTSATTSDNEPDILKFGAYHFDLNNRSVSFKDNTPALTEMDFKLARFLFENCGRLLTRDYLLEQIWGLQGLRTRTVDTHMSKLRRLLALYPENGFLVRTVYQRGYRLESVDRAAQSVD